MLAEELELPLQLLRLTGVSREVGAAALHLLRLIGVSREVAAAALHLLRLIGVSREVELPHYICCVS